jgi:hypothetical protein
MLELPVYRPTKGQTYETTQQFIATIEFMVAQSHGVKAKLVDGFSNLLPFLNESSEQTPTKHSKTHNSRNKYKRAFLGIHPQY